MKKMYKTLENTPFFFFKELTFIFNACTYDWLSP